MFARIRRGWELTKASFKVLQLDKEILVLPVLAFVSLIVGVLAWAAIGFATLGSLGLTGGATTTMHYVLYFCMYVTTAFVGTFFLAATIEMASIRLEGGDPVVRDGLAKAWEKKGKLLGWAVVTATVGMLLRLLRERARGLGRFVGAFLELGWAVATFFAVPVLVYQDVGPFGAVKQSGKMMKDTWGEAGSGVVSVGIVFIVLGLLGIVPIALGVVVGTGLAIGVGIAVAVLYWGLLAAMNSAVDGILKAALYRFAETGEIPEGFESAQPAQIS